MLILQLPSQGLGGVASTTVISIPVRFGVVPGVEGAT